MTFSWNPVCYDHKVKVMKGELLNRSIIFSNNHYYGGNVLSCSSARLVWLK